MELRRRPGRLLLAVLVLVAVALITIDFRRDGGLIDRAKEIAEAIVEPVQRGIARAVDPVADFFSGLGELGSLRAENERLSREVRELRTREREASSVLEENERLRAELELDESWASMDRVAAEVISRSPSNYRWLLRIDKGSSDGLRKDMSVITSEGLVGKLLEVGENSSIVLELADPQAGVAAKTRGGTATGAVTGNGAGEPLTMELVPGEAVIRVGDEILTSAFNQGIFPANIPVGRVVEVKASGAAGERVIEIEPYVDFSSLEFVQILLESGPKLAEQTP